MKKLTKLLFGLLVFLTIACHEKPETVSHPRILLNEGWEFKGTDTLNWMPATVPGTVHTDLLANRVIGDPYYRTNEKNQQWIDKRDWEYQTTFDVPEQVLQESHVTLFFKGLDTYAKVYLNDQLILSADNFFRSWEVEAKEYLKATDNTLRIVFESPIQIGLQKLEAHGYPLPASNDQSENGELGDKRVSIFTRKPGYHYGWDWGPRFVTSGIWQDIVLSGWSEFSIDDVFYDQQEVSESLAKIDVQIGLQSDVEKEANVSVKADGKILAEKSIQLKKGSNTVTVPLEMENPQLWWTHELGTPKLYDFEVAVAEGSKTLAIDEQRVGIRSIEVIREKDSTGRSFYFKLNGLPVFAKGANYIPNDLFLPRVDDKRYAGVVQAAVDANMNMLRVWGGGLYEKDVFYDLCDEKGVLVWQDFMFACSMYPGDSAFLANVKAEAHENIIRLRNHPSLALWCGNNENDVAWEFWGWKKDYTPEQQAEIQRDYDKVFYEILPEAVAELNPATFYWPSSPYNGEGSHATADTKSGDVHYWGVWHGQEPFEAFADHVGRFMSEYGFQSFPDFETVKTFTQPEDWDIESEVMAAHQRSGIGNLRIKEYMEEYYQLPNNFRDLLYMGQVLQAEGMRSGMETHRRAMPYCMGSLYWQINDCWPVASWSGMDYYLKWKGLHYFAKKAFAPVLLSPYQEDDQLKITLVNDQIDAVKGTLQIKVMDFSGKVIKESSEALEVPAQTASNVYAQAANELVGPADQSKQFLLAQLVDAKGEVIAEHLFYFKKVKFLDLPKVRVNSTVSKNGNAWEITLNADQLAKNVYVNFEGLNGHFSDNYFDLLPGEKRVLTYKPKEGENPTADLLKIKTVRDTY